MCLLCILPVGVGINVPSCVKINHCPNVADVEASSTDVWSDKDRELLSLEGRDQLRPFCLIDVAVEHSH